MMTDIVLEFKHQIQSLTDEYYEWLESLDPDIDEESINSMYADNPIYKAWNAGDGIFDCLDGGTMSCLTQIKYGLAGPWETEEHCYSSGNKHLDELIRLDTGIPRPEHLRPEHLQRFAELQEYAHGVWCD